MKKQLNLEQMQGIRGKSPSGLGRGARISDLVIKEVADEAQGLEDDDEAPQMDISDEYSYENDDGESN